MKLPRLFTRQRRTRLASRVQSARQGHARNLGPEERPGQLYVSDRHPGAYLAITKCGSSFMLNLWHQIEYGVPHPQGEDIHQQTEVLKRGVDLSLSDVRANPYAFVVLRNPVDRFFSLYFDKLTGPDAAFRNLLLKLFDDPDAYDWDPQSPEAHHANCRMCIAAFRKSNDNIGRALINPHWLRQSVRTNRSARLMHLAALTIEDLEPQLHVLLGGVIPDLAGHIEAVRVRNRSRRTVSQSDILDDALESEILDVYRRDMDTWEEVREAWSHVDLSRPDPRAAPRLYPLES